MTNAPARGHKHRIQIGSFEELRNREGEVVDRIAALPNGGELFHIDPVRLLGDVGVTLSKGALVEWRERVGEGWPDTVGSEPVYDMIRGVAPGGRPAVMVLSILGDSR